MTAEEQWEAMVAPYGAAARELGYRILDRTVPESDLENLCTCFDGYFDDDCTFLDFAGAIPTGPVARKYVTGFHHVQFLTFVQTPEGTQLVTTNGVPPEQRRARAPWIFRWIEKRLPERLRPFPMRGPEDLPLVLDRHRRAVLLQRGSTIRPDQANPLAWRWRRMEEFA